MNKIKIKRGVRLSLQLEEKIEALEAVMERRGCSFGMEVRRGYIFCNVFITLKYLFSRFIFLLLNPKDRSGQQELFKNTLQEHIEGRAMDIRIVDDETGENVIPRPWYGVFLSESYSRRAVHHYQNIFDELIPILTEASLHLSDDHRERLQIHVVLYDE